MAPDRSNGYEAIAETFARCRTASIGPAVVRRWVQRFLRNPRKTGAPRRCCAKEFLPSMAARKDAPFALPRGASVLDLGCGNGVPISETLIQEGFAVYGVDASETLVAKFRERFPGVAVECCPVEDSAFFGRTFEAVVAWGLMFLLPVETQLNLIGKVARALKHDGQFLFTSPREACWWLDGLTGLPSFSPGHEIYEAELARQGLVLVGNDADAGDNYYYFAAKRRG